MPWILKSFQFEIETLHMIMKSKCFIIETIENCEKLDFI